MHVGYTCEYTKCIVAPIGSITVSFILTTSISIIIIIRSKTWFSHSHSHSLLDPPNKSLCSHVTIALLSDKQTYWDRLHKLKFIAIGDDSDHYTKPTDTFYSLYQMTILCIVYIVIWGINPTLITGGRGK